MGKYSIEVASKMIFEMLRREHSLQDLVNLGANLLGTYTSYSNSAYKHRAISDNYPEEDIIERNNYFEFQDPMVAYNELTLSLESQSDNTPFIMSATGTRRRWISKSYYCGKHVGHFTVPEADVPLEEVDTGIIMLMSDACAISYMMKNSVSTLNHFMPTQASLLESVLNGSIKDLKSFNDNARLYSQKTYSTYFLICGTFSDDIDSHTIQLISNQIEYCKYNSQAILFEGKVVFLVGTDDKDEISEKLINSLNYMCKTYNVYLAISDPFYNIMEARVQFRYANEVLKILLEDYKGEHILFHDECKIKMFIRYTKEHIENINDFVPSVLKKIMLYDKNNGTAYTQTLKNFLMSSCSPAVTAEKMFVHKNTIIYRVKKMSELFNIDYNNTMQILSLQLAFVFMDFSEN